MMSSLPSILSTDSNDFEAAGAAYAQAGPSRSSLPRMHMHMPLDDHSRASIFQSDQSYEEQLDQHRSARQPQPPPKISKRINKRLQLAAALIEADNDDIEERNLAHQASLLRARQQQQQQQADPDAPGPAPLPQPKLASQSVIFAPFRDEPQHSAASAHTRRRTASNASRLSRLSGGVTANEEGRRPSIDFLGVKLPTDKKNPRTSSMGSRPASAAGFSRHSRANSLMSATGPLRPGDTVWGGPAGDGSRPGSALSHSRHGSLHTMAAAAASEGGESEAGSEEALSEWGVDKFLSKDAREKLSAGRRSRANSTVGITTVPASASRPASVISVSAPARPQSMIRTHSEIGTGATGIPNGPDGSVSAAQAQLLARIKMYRERQENLPPSEWSGPGPAADATEVAKHLAIDEHSTPAAARPDSSAAALAASKRSLAFPSADGETHDVAKAQRSPIQNVVASIFGVPPPRFSSTGGLDALSRDASAGGAGLIGLDGTGTSTSAAANESQLSADIRPVTHLRSATVESTNTVASAMSLQRRDSSMGIFGESWSDQEDEDEVPSTELQDQTITRSASQGDTTVRRDHVNQSSRTQDAEEIGNLQGPFAEPSVVVDSIEESVPSDMAGVGSFSRGQSRRNSLMTGAPGMLWADTANEAPSLRPGEMLHSSRPGTPGGLGSSRGSGQATPILGEGASLPLDPYASMSIGPSPYPAAHRASPAARLLELGSDPYAVAERLGPYPRGIAQSTPESLAPTSKARRKSAATTNMSTKQLQQMARQSAFGGYYGIGSPGDSPPLQAADDAELLSAAGLDPLSAIAEPRLLDAGVGEASQEYAALAEHLAEHDRREASASNDVPNPKPRPFSSFFGTASTNDKRASNAGPSILATAAALRASAVPDLSSVRWGTKRRTAAPATTVEPPSTDYADHAKEDPLSAAGKAARGNSRSLFNPISTLMGSGSNALIEKLQKAADEQQRHQQAAPLVTEVDDSEFSPPVKGPLRPRGLEARIPSDLVMPTPLEGSPYAPRIRLTDAHGRDIRELRASLAQRSGKKTGLYVPEGFVLHDGRGLPPVKQLTIGASGAPKLAFMEGDGNQKHDTVMAALLADSRRTINVPAAAPAGIGRRAAAPSTALFRNQLVQHDDERTGWGWEAGTQTGEVGNASSSEDGNVPLADLKKLTRAAKRAARKTEKERRKRKKARAERRRKRRIAETSGTSYEALGVESDSPAEDLDLSEDSEPEDDLAEDEESASEDSFNSEDEKRWVDDKKPAGKLFGKSLIDVADERRQNLVSKNRAYGHIEAEEIRKFEALEAAGMDADGDARSIAPSTAAKTFRDNPLGYNDTRERMQAAFGKDALWEREMAVRREEEAREAAEREVKRLAELEYRKGEAERAMHKLKGKKGKKNQAKYEAAALEFARLHKEINGREASFVSRNPESASIAPTVEDEQDQGIAQTEEDEMPARSRTPIEPPKLDLSLLSENAAGGISSLAAQTKRKGVSEAAAEWFARESDEDLSEQDTSEDEAEKRKQALERARKAHTQNSASVSFAAALNLPRVRVQDENGSDSEASENDSSSEDNIPLSQLRKKASPRVGSSTSFGNVAGGPPRIGADDESSEEEMPLAAIVAKRKTRQSLAGKLDIDFMGASSLDASATARSSMPAASSRSSALGPPIGLPALQRAAPHTSQHEDDDSDDDAPLGVKHGNGLAALAELTKKEAQLKQAREKVADLQDAAAAQINDSDDDDRPLGVAHPQAAIIAEQRALIEKLQAEAAEARAKIAATESPFGVGPPYGFNSRMSMMPGAGPFGQPSIAPGHMSMIGMPSFGPSTSFGGGMFPQSPGPNNIGVPIGMDPTTLPPGVGLGPDPKATSIDRWRSQVPIDPQPSTSSNSK
ncbi:hypothetical protein IE81DRAFT_349054 [Ceraceosorus guamensis]|uniref:Uncharacterized protein n=1 Tax=Ceraceosorus guamensis TaxID=1522189 RepID=A0A316VSR3_9BASI|nr:hypothetical protein IE81DRAFT_349054 [Ceraceosorus guamensis]PWN40636.1 hypothetical protein IE81DRAFT_349054 [Ceraceosorus guamensis]